MQNLQRGLFRSPWTWPPRVHLNVGCETHGLQRPRRGNPSGRDRSSQHGAQVARENLYRGVVMIGQGVLDIIDNRDLRLSLGCLDLDGAAVEEVQPEVQQRCDQTGGTEPPTSWS